MKLWKRKHVVPVPKALSTAEYWFQSCSSLWSHASTSKISVTNEILWLLIVAVCGLGYRYSRRRHRKTNTKTVKGSASLSSRPPRFNAESSRSSRSSVNDSDDSDDDDDDDATLNAEIRAKAAQAALNRSAVHDNKRLALQKKHQQEQLERATREHSAAPLCIPCVPSSNVIPPTISSPELLPLYNDGLTIVRHIPTLPRADTVAGLLHQLAVEFVPILRARHYDVVSISEFCCCGDGMEYELGQGGCGRTLGSRARPGQRIAGHESTTVAGYNQLHQSNNRRVMAATARHRNSIHLRLRHPPPTPSSSTSSHADTTTNALHHYTIISYAELCLHMAHELAHCVHRHHGPEFQALMRDILSEYETRYSWH
jgi:hypothetical protein